MKGDQPWENMQAMKMGYKYVGKLHRVDNIFEKKPNVYFQNYKKDTPIMTNLFPYSKHRADTAT